MTAALPDVPLPIRCGEPLDVTVAVLDATDAPVPAGQILSALAQVRARVGTTVLHEWTTTGAAPNAQVTSAGVRLTATPAETLAWQTDWPTHMPRWDLVVTVADGSPRRVLRPSFVQLDPVLTRT